MDDTISQKFSFHCATFSISRDATLTESQTGAIALVVLLASHLAGSPRVSGTSLCSTVLKLNSAKYRKQRPCSCTSVFPERS